MALLKTLVLILLFVYGKGFQCKNENNESVDWFYLYKLPKDHNKNSLIENGVSYMFMTSKDYNSGWKLSNTSLDNSRSIPGLTLSPFYKNETSMNIFYNDEIPDGPKTDKLGHTKGVLLSDENTGFWLIHSVPKYPPTDKYYYPDTGLRYGQSFLCISFNLENINNVGKQLLYNEPQIYNSYLSKSLQNKLSNINSVISNEKISYAPWYRLTTLQSLNGQKFISFAKSRNFGKEIYEDWIAPTLKSDLLVETWLNGAGKIPSECNLVYSVHNVETIQLPGITFSSSKDHSKWALTDNKSTKNTWICVGDINREEHQKERGGGTVCINNVQIWNEYKRSVKATELCNS